jgi:cold shock protein
MQVDQVGIVKWFNGQKGYGFITPDSGGKDLFVHYSDVKMDGFRILKEGQRVKFKPTDGPKGPQATEVHITE